MTDERNEINQQTEIDSLVVKLSESRTELTKCMTDLDGLRSKVGELFPQGQDFRNKWVLEEKIKAMSSLYSTLLSFRQEYNKTIKEEIDIRRKIVNGEADADVDIRSLASSMENLIRSKKESDK